MERELLFQMLMPLNLGLFGAMFFAVYFYEKRLKFTGWVGMGFVCGMLASLIDILQSKISWSPFYFDDFSNPLFWSVGTCFAIALSSRYRHSFPWKLVALIYIAGFSSQLYFRHLDHQMVIQESISNGIAGVLLLITAYFAWRKGTKIIDKIVWIIFAAAGLSNFLRTIAVLWIMENDITAANYATSLFATTQLLVSAITAAFAAIILLALCAFDLFNIYSVESKTDSLTGLSNRRGLDKHIESINSQDGLTGYHLIVCDLDNFKKINDEYGHYAGDMVLQRVGNIMSMLTKSFGFAARTGGEEFVVLVRPVESKATRFVADQLCQSLRQLTHPELPEGINATGSFGITAIKEHESYSRAYARADAALYEAKANGRDQVFDADDPEFCIPHLRQSG